MVLHFTVIAATWELPKPLVLAIADHHLTGRRAPHIVEAVSRIRHSNPVDSLEAFRNHCIEHLKLNPDLLDQIVEEAQAESGSLAQVMESPSGRSAAPVQTIGSV